ncbi:MAG: hypothetical protein JWQ88_1830 [Rhodoferax sp.]|nr:hypothetical protein [Rhodoferax sp.]
MTHAATLFRLASASLLLALGACASRPPESAPVSPFEQDVIEATDGLAGQWRGLSGYRMHWLADTVALGPFVDMAEAGSTMAPGYARPQSVATARARQVVARHIDAALHEFKLVPQAVPGGASPELLLSASLVPMVIPISAGAAIPVASTTEPMLVLTLVLTDLRSQRIVARWQKPLRNERGNALPAAFDAASTVLFRQSDSEREALLFNAPVPTQLDDGTLEGAVGLAQLHEAQARYAAGDYARALTQFQAVAAKSPALAARAYNGEYLAQLKLGQPEAARLAFQRVVAAGLASRSLAVKLLFAPGETAFWADPEVSGPYAGWLTEIARQASAAPTCVEVAGHTSRTGDQRFNETLSLARSERVRQLLAESQPSLAGRMHASGKGWTENIVGSGTDDARDAIDRRVEFKIADCAIAAAPSPGP